MRVSDRPGFGRWGHFARPHSPSSGCCIGRLLPWPQCPSSTPVFLDTCAPICAMRKPSLGRMPSQTILQRIHPVGVEGEEAPARAQQAEGFGRAGRGVREVVHHAAQ
jgi:hypothetical protein